MLRARPRRGALGLRGRIVGLVLVTTVATLSIAALVLLPRLENSLRTAAQTTLKHDLRGATKPWSKIELTYVADITGKYAGKGFQARSEVYQADKTLASRLGVNVTLLGFPDSRGNFTPVPPLSSAPDDAFDDAIRTFRSGRAYYSFGTIDGADVVRAILPVKPGFVLAVRKRIDEIPGAVAAVRTAFLTAALAGLALTLVLAIPLAATLVRRLRRLRHATLKVAQGDLAVDVPVDRARDEVGDLARTFAVMQRRLHHQEEARRAFVATASHELRTPLASLDGMLELLDDDLRSGDPDIDDARALLERARVQSRRLGRLAADLLDLSRLDAEVQLRSEPVELGELSRAVMAEFELGTQDREIELVLNDSAGPVWALGDPGSVARIVRILLDNAVRVSPAGAEIRVQLGNGDRAWLSVCDDGPGVSPDERELIFERFQRGRDATAQAGFGLGLAIGRELSERMRGELVLEDTDQPGARFTLRLPVARAPDHDAVAIA